MIFFPLIKRHYNTELQIEELKGRFERKVAKPDKQFTFQKAADNGILEGSITENGFVVVMGRYGMNYGKTSLLPFLFGKFKPSTGKTIRLVITIQPSLGSGLVILSLVYILAAIAIYISWTQGRIQGVIIPVFFIIVTYVSMLLKFNKEKKIYLDFIEKDLL